ncbi:MAG TPA: IS4 family transposase [Roseiarcus sp.]|nr:IS4 family transposase [Roseiarcus sp.]
MRYIPTTFEKLLEPLNRRQFEAIVERYRGDAYAKTFDSWDHLLTLLHAQLSGVTSLRGLETTWNANGEHHYHLGVKKVARSTLSDVNKRRPVAIFLEAFNLVAKQLSRLARREAAEICRLIDSTPIPLGKLCEWALSNGRIRGMKMHVVYDPCSFTPRILDITHANVNDAEIGRAVPIEAGATYVFDKGYCHYGWWREIAEKGAFFVTRAKTNMRLRSIGKRPIGQIKGDGFTVLEDAEVRLVSKSSSRLPMRLRRIKIKRDEGGPLTLLTNDMERSAADIALLYKGRWQIELFFRWIKQHLELRKFLGKNENAIRLQLVTAMIAYALIRIAATVHRLKIPIHRFLELVIQCLFERRDIAALDKPPPVNPSRRRDRTCPNQLSFAYA